MARIGEQMTTRLCVVRHGETAWNAEHRVQGQLDVPLNAIGQAQALAASKVLAQEKFDAIYSSDLSRARQTAQPTASAISMEMRLERNLRERHYGIFERLTYAEVKTRYPEDYARFEARDPDYAFRTGESLRDFSARSIAAISRIAEQNRDQSILVFTHGGVLDKLYRFITGLPLSAPRDFGIPNAGLNRIEVTAAGWQIRTWADVAHLDGALDDLPE
ncbi:MAG TPA: histidine phosphatase family protein [Burkholderiales bacterium]|nr:histidine phosphatase family protein [Burkholderiales bacterium]